MRLSSRGRCASLAKVASRRPPVWVLPAPIKLPPQWSSGWFTIQSPKESLPVAGPLTIIRSQPWIDDFRRHRVREGAGDLLERGGSCFSTLRVLRAVFIVLSYWVRWTGPLLQRVCLGMNRISHGQWGPAHAPRDRLSQYALDRHLRYTGSEWVF